jgi:hypothetical protein
MNVLGDFEVLPAEALMKQSMQNIPGNEYSCLCQEIDRFQCQSEAVFRAELNDETMEGERTASGWVAFPEHDIDRLERWKLKL